MQIPYTYPIWRYLFTPILREWATSLSVYDKQELYHQGSFQWDQGNNPYPCSTRIPASLVSWFDWQNMTWLIIIAAAWLNMIIYDRHCWTMFLFSLNNMTTAMIDWWNNCFMFFSLTNMDHDCGTCDHVFVARRALRKETKNNIERHE